MAIDRRIVHNDDETAGFPPLDGFFVDFVGAGVVELLAVDNLVDCAVLVLVCEDTADV